METYHNNIQDNSGNAILTAVVRVFEEDGVTLASIFQDDGITPLGNPITQSSGYYNIKGEIRFLAPNDQYVLSITTASGEMRYVIHPFDVDDTSISAIPDSDSRIYFEENGSSLNDGRTLQKPVDSLATAISRAQALQVLTPGLRVVILSSTANTFDIQAITITEDIWVVTPNASYTADVGVTGELIHMDTRTQLFCTTITNTQGGECVVIEDANDVICSAVQVINTASDGIVVQGNCNNTKIVWDRAVVARYGLWNKSTVSAATATGLVLEANLTELFANNAEALRQDSDLFITGFLRGVKHFADSAYTGTSAYNIISGDLRLDSATVEDVGTFIHVQSGTSTLTPVSGEGDIIVDVGATLNISVPDHASGTVTVNGTLNGIIDGVRYGEQVVDASDVVYTGTPPVNYTPSDPDVESHLEAIDTVLSIANNASELLSTGFVGNPPVLTINAGDNTKYDMSSGTIIVVDTSTTPSTSTQVVVPAVVAGTLSFLATDSVTFISVDVTGNPVQRTSKLTPEQRRDEAVVGLLTHPDNLSIATAVNIPQIVINPLSQFSDLVNALGFFSTSGNQVSGVASQLELQKATGTGFALNENADTNEKDPHNINLPILNPITLFQTLQTGEVVVESATLDPTTYDNAGVLTAVPANNNATISYVYLFPNNVVSLLKGQEVFGTFSEAKDAAGTESVVVPSLENQDGLLLARVIMKKNATDTTDTSEVFILPSTEVSGGSAALTTLQQAYDISIEPEIETNATRGAVSIKEGQGNDALDVFEVKNGADSQTLAIDGNGNILGSGTRGSVDQLTDVDISTTTPSIGDALVYDGSDFVPTKAETFTHQDETVASYSGSSWKNITGLAITLTPNDLVDEITFHINVVGALNWGAFQPYGDVRFRLLKNGSVMNLPTARGSRTQVHGTGEANDTEGEASETYDIVAIDDSPDNGVSTTYQVQVYNIDQAFLYNRTEADTDNADHISAQSTIIATESF